MILSDYSIRRRLKQGRLTIEELEDPDLQIQPASVDVRLGDTFLVPNPNVKRLSPGIDIENAMNEIIIDGSDPFILGPGRFALATTIESVEIPPDLVAQVEGRSSLGRLAVECHQTAGFIDPGFRGQITLELKNNHREDGPPIDLEPGMRIAQLVFTRLTTAAEKPYGTGRRSKYQDQEGPQASKLGDDVEYEQPD